MAAVALAVIALFLVLRFLVVAPARVFNVPLQIALVVVGVPLLYELGLRAMSREFGSDLLAGISIAASVILGQYFAGTVIALMLAGGKACVKSHVHLFRDMPGVARLRTKSRTPRLVVLQ